MLTEFVVYVVTIFAAVWGSILLAWGIRRRDREIGNAPDERMLAGVRDELEIVTERLARLEEEVGFFRELNAPSAGRELPPGSDESESGPA